MDIMFFSLLQKVSTGSSTDFVGITRGTSEIGLPNLQAHQADSWSHDTNLGTSGSNSCKVISYGAGFESVEHVSHEKSYFLCHLYPCINKYFTLCSYDFSVNDFQSTCISLGSETLPKGIVCQTSDMEMVPLWGPPNGKVYYVFISQFYHLVTQLLSVRSFKVLTRDQFFQMVDPGNVLTGSVSAGIICNGSVLTSTSSIPDKRSSKTPFRHNGAQFMLHKHYDDHVQFLGSIYCLYLSAIIFEFWVGHCVVQLQKSGLQQKVFVL